jgi:hypothetical protein
LRLGTTGKIAGRERCCALKEFVVISDNKAVGFPKKEIPDNDEPPHDEDQRQKALFEWAERVLKAAGLLKVLRDAKTREELESIKFEPGNVALVMAINDALHPDKKREKHFEHLTAKALEKILQARFNAFKRDEHKKLINNERQTAADEEARERAEEDVKLYGDFGQYKVRDRGVFVHTEEELETGEKLPKWLQISRTRIELEAVTRSKEGHNWGVCVRMLNMDGRVTRLAIPRNIINDQEGNVAGRLADLGADIVREEREHLPDFLLTTVELVNNNVQPLTRFMAVQTTGWYQLNNDKWVFVLPHTTKPPKDLAAGELAVFQTDQLHLNLKNGFAIEGTIEEWREQILEPFAGNSNVTLAVGTALSGPLMVWAAVPPGLFHIFAASKHAKSLASAIGQSIYGRPLIPKETNADPFGLSWYATASHIGELILTRASIGAFIEELNQGTAKVIANAAYLVANGISKGRLRGRKLEPRLSYCVPGFSTGELAMVDFLSRNGEDVTDGIRTRFADIPADVQENSIFEKFSEDQIPELGSKYYPLLGKLYGAVGNAWLQHLVDLGPQQITATVNRYKQDFQSRPKVRALYAVAAPYARSVVDRFAVTAAACRMGIDASLLWKNNADPESDIEACMMRWAEHEQLDTVVTAIAQFMRNRQSWQGRASELKSQSNGAIDSAEALGRWLKKSENLRRLKVAGFTVEQRKSKTRDRSKLIHIERGRMDGSDSSFRKSEPPSS